MVVFGGRSNTSGQKVPPSPSAQWVSASFSAAGPAVTELLTAAWMGRVNAQIVCSDTGPQKRFALAFPAPGKFPSRSGRVCRGFESKR